MLKRKCFGTYFSIAILACLQTYDMTGSVIIAVLMGCVVGFFVPILDNF